MGHDRRDGARPLERREILKRLAVAGAAGATAPGLFASDPAAIDAERIAACDWLAGIEFTAAERDLMVQDVTEQLASFEAMRAVPLDNAVPPAFRFDPEPGTLPAPPPDPHRPWPKIGPKVARRRPADDDLAFAGIAELAALLGGRFVSAVELTRFALDRLARFDPQLHCVVTSTAERALEAARDADRRLADDGRRNVLDGIPWGAKDLLAARGSRTTWGAEPYREQSFDRDATVVARLEASGAPLVAKLAVGALAWGDVWFGGMTRNPWNPEQGSSGSSAGSAAAVAAGLVPFAIGTETWGSIVSPCTRCGVTGIRPTFGRVPRSGCMALSWTMDKIGPLARSVRDAATVLRAIEGPDGLDGSAIAPRRAWNEAQPLARLRVGFAPALFDGDRAAGAEDDAARAAAAEWAAFDRATLEVLRGLGVTLRDVVLPARPETPHLAILLSAEAAAAFDDLTRSGRDDLLARQVRDAWPNVLRAAQLIPAVEYLRANRLRTLLLRDWEALFERIDVLVTPSFEGDVLLATNLTGHPCVVLPNGFRSQDGTPTSITFVGRLHGEPDLVELAAAYQDATDFHLRRPPQGA